MYVDVQLGHLPTPEEVPVLNVHLPIFQIMCFMV